MDRSLYSKSRPWTHREVIVDTNFLINNNNPIIIKYLSDKYGLKSRSFENILDYLDQYISSFTNNKGDDPSPENSSDEETIPKIKLELQKDFDPKKYAGLWYDAGRIPQPFDKNTPWETAKYKLMKDGSIQVENTAYNRDGSIRGRISGKAEVVDKSEPAALYVSFPTGQPRPAQIYPNYLIHTTDYDNYSVVGSLDGSNLYFLVRDRPISKKLYDRMTTYAKTLGYDTNKVIPDYGAISDKE